MIAICWLLLAWAAGWRLSGLLIGDSRQLLLSLSGRQSRGLILATPWPILFFRLSTSLWLGLLPLTWLTYGGAALLASRLPLSIHPLLAINLLVFVTVGTWLVWPHLRRLIRDIRRTADWKQAGSPGPGWATLVRSFRQPSALFYLVTAGLWLLLGTLLMFGTFYRDGTLYRAGYSVFSDFAPHTALVSSFSEGRNWPTEYPHFANDGISYHFMFFFLCGNLNYLGLPLDWAINLPSILGLLTFCLLLGTLALCLTGRRITWLLAPLLLFCRSSLAFFTFLGGLVRQYGAAPAAWPQIIQAMLHQETYIGNTANDSWGLWGINVYANQRHLLPGLSIALIVLFLFLPFLQDGLSRRPTLRQLILGRDFWLDNRRESWQRLLPALLLCLLLPYFHGSALIALLIILAGISIFSTNRLLFAILGGASAASALLQSWFLAGQATRVVQPSILIGFIAADKSLAGILAYLLEMSGIVIPLMLLVFWLPGRRRKVLLAAFMLPLVFAFTVSLTPDVTVNHKYIMISFALGNIYIADLLARIWPERKAAPTARPERRLAWLTGLSRRLAAILLAIILMITGWQEMIILHNISKKTVAIDSASPLVTWICRKTSPDAVFVSAPLHYNAFFLSGRATWLGHAYYAWSAGHDTASRLVQEQWLLSGGGGIGNLAAVRQLIADNGLDYLLLDDTLRRHPEFSVDEAFFDSHFPVVAEFPGLGSLKIYDLSQILD